MSPLAFAVSTKLYRMPAIFISHGAPVIALDPLKRQEFMNWAEAMPKPSAILVISVHWQTSGLVSGTTISKKPIYDFGGFPEELYQLQYAATGAPRLAQRVTELLQSKFEQDTQQSGRGWDHGVWVPLVLMYPEADIPVLQLGLPKQAASEQLFNLGIALTPLREEGILIIGNGQITHNLAALSALDEPVVGWAQAFDNRCRETLDSRDWDRLLNYRNEAPDLEMNHPTD